MCNRVNLPNRVRKAHAAKNFIKVLSRDADNRIRKVLVPGSEGKQYQVIIRRDPITTVELLLDTGMGLIKPYYAFKYITYHAMAALMIAAEENDYRLAWCANRDDAYRLARLGGRVVVIANYDNRNVKEYAVIYDR